MWYWNQAVGWYHSRIKEQVRHAPHQILQQRQADALIPGDKFDDRWVVERKLGEGGFGAVYEAADSHRFIKEPLALKMERRDARDLVLKIEVAVLEDLRGSTHFCQLFDCGRNEKFNFILMSVLGPCLSQLRRRRKDVKFSLGTGLKVAHQCFEGVHDMHNAGWLHRDIKPSNFAMGKCEERKKTVYLFDFGLARTYLTKKKRTLRPKRDRVGFRGTVRYASITTHLKQELGRQDDLISVMYSFLEMVSGKLPWRHLDDRDQVLLCKEEYYPMLYKGLPPALKSMHDYMISLKYDDKPKYGMIEEQLYELIHSNGFHLEPYDWEIHHVKGKPWEGLLSNPDFDPASDLSD